MISLCCNYLPENWLWHFAFVPQISSSSSELHAVHVFSIASYVTFFPRQPVSSTASSPFVSEVFHFSMFFYVSWLFSLFFWGGLCQSANILISNLLMLVRFSLCQLLTWFSLFCSEKDFYSLMLPSIPFFFSFPFPDSSLSIGTSLSKKIIWPWLVWLLVGHYPIYQEISGLIPRSEHMPGLWSWPIPFGGRAGGGQLMFFVLFSPSPFFSL